MGQTVNPRDIVRIERLGARLSWKVFDETNKEKFSWATIEGGTIKLTEDQLRKELLQIVKTFEPEASETRFQELVGRIVDRTMNFRVVYINRRTHEVTT